MGEGVLVSAVISNYNYGRFLEDAVASVLEQTYRPIELIVVDDGSTDDSRELLSSLSTFARIIEQSHRGQAAALDAGAAAARGEFICFLDADDRWLRTKVRRVVDTFEAHARVEWLRHTLSIVREDLLDAGATIPRIRRSTELRLDPQLITERIITMSTSGFALRRGIARRIFPLVRAGGAPHPPKFHFDADALLLARCALERAVGYSLAEPLGVYRRHGSQQFRSAADVSRMIERQIQVARALAELMGLPEPSSNYKHRAILAALDGNARSRVRRVREFAKGMGAALPLARRPHYFARQVGGLAFATLAPGTWLRKLQVDQALPG